MKRQKNRHRAAVLVGCILLACIACVRLVTAYGVLRPSRPPEQLRLSAGKEWTGAVKLEEFGGLCWDATQQEVQDALAFCNSCTQFPREEEGALMLGMGATFRQLVLERGRSGTPCRCSRAGSPMPWWNTPGSGTGNTRPCGRIFTRGMRPCGTGRNRRCAASKTSDKRDMGKRGPGE